ncbi:autoinducer binding domain-containing protein [Legionella feeleii]|uniref:Uncharacterized protein n=1 Tax=Legionella feeleii TaxID=453 RepID=A0A378IW37_9GAMM|nr:autoinducer binding domain-containing protein [Legionella feeleii]STX39273.1 Uncharacterised protein [Legionella feeleii]
MDVCATQKARSLPNIFPEKFELQFYQAFHTLKNLGCDYLYFMGLHAGISYRFCTHENWIAFYNDEKFILNDPLKRVAESSTFLVAPWEQVTHLHSNEKKTMSGRISFGLFNGLTLSRQYCNRKYIFALATELKEHDLARYLLLERMDKLERVICDYMRLFNQYLMLMFEPVTHVM